MSTPVDIDNYTELIVLDDDELQKEGVTSPTRERLKRLRALYAYWLQFPTKTAKEIVDYNISMFSIGRAQAYDDLHLTELLLGSLQRASKDFMRWKINRDLEHDLQMARRKGDLRAVAAIEKNRITNNRTDKEDEQELEFSKIVPQQFLPTDDPSVIGIKKQKDQRAQVRYYEKKYGRDIEDAEYEEIKDDGTTDNGET
ncbi:MAG: hypothetical protein PUF37_05795 [Prevotellaceae bacterium]|nr:hypothetical protein [Prevotellaceae bacterium]